MVLDKFVKLKLKWTFNNYICIINICINKSWLLFLLKLYGSQIGKKEKQKGKIVYKLQDDK